MSNVINPFLLTDGYKISHHKMYPKGTTLVYSNFTPRSNKWSPMQEDHVVVFGVQFAIMHIHEIFSASFFRRNKAEVIDEIKREYSAYVGADYDTTHIEKLWDLGYLPIEVKSLPEGTLCPIGVPLLTIKNTHPEFFWVTNFLETLISNLLWKPITSATIARGYKKILLQWALKTDSANKDFVNFQGHDFSMRGMDSPLAAAASGAGHLTSFLGSDTLPAIHFLRKYYYATGAGNLCYSVPASEHSVMCAGEQEKEVDTFRYLMSQYPEGILSIVSDTWDLWKVCTEILTELRLEILERKGKVVIRPDSGDPISIICGDTSESRFLTSHSQAIKKGVVELLWDIFGGTINEQGYKVLDPHIGVIYGDSITLERADTICRRLEEKGFASTNCVFGIGSFTYQYNTRDTYGFAMKATYVEIKGKCLNINEDDTANPYECDNCTCTTSRNIQKDPVTSSGINKKSATGLLRVDNVAGNYVLRQEQTWEQEKGGELKTVYENGHFVRFEFLSEIRERLA
jgi:nicotinamide phosphoribosyltransferase